MKFLSLVRPFFRLRASSFGRVCSRAGAASDPRGRGIAAFTLGLGLISGAAALRAQTTFTWTGAGNPTTGILDQNNWSTHVLPAGQGSDNIVFGPAVNSSVAVPASFAVNDITFNGTSRPAYTFTGASSPPTLTLGGNVTMQTAGDVAFSNNLNLALTSGTHTITVLSGSSVTAQGVVSGTGAAVKAGAGTLVLSGTNTFSGGLTLNAGTLDLNNDHALGNGSLTIAGGTIDNTSGGTISLFNAQTWSGDFTFVGTQNLRLGAAGITLSGGTTRIVTVAARTLTVTGAIDDGSSTIGLTKAGAGTLLLAGANTYHGSTIVSAGTLRLGTNDVIPDSSTVNLTSSSATFNLSGQTDTVGALAGVSGSTIALLDGALTTSSHSSSTFAGNIVSTGSVTKEGTGTLTLSGTNGEFLLAGNNGKITIAADGARGSGDWSFSNSAVLNANATNSLGSGPDIYTYFSDSAVLKANASGAVSGGTVNFNSARPAVGSTDDDDSQTAAELDANHVNAITGGSQTFDGNTSLQIGASGNLTGSVITGVITGGAQTFRGDSELKTHTSSSYVISGGAQTFDGTATLVASGSNIITGGSQRFYSPGENDLSALYSFFETHDRGPFSPSDTFAHFLTSASDDTVRDFLNATAHLTVTADSTATSSNGAITSGQQDFYSYSSLQANHANAVTGGTQTFHDNSHLRASQGNAIYGTTQTFYDSSFLWATATGAVSNVTLNLFNTSQIILGATDALTNFTWIVFNNPQSLSPSNASGALVADGGTLVLNGNSTRVAAVNSQQTGAGNIQNGGSALATLTLDGSVDSTFSGILSDGGSGKLLLTKNGAGTTLTLSGDNNTYTGPTTISAGTLQVLNDAGSATGTGLVTVMLGATLQIGNGTLPGIISGSLIDNGTVIVNQNSDHTYAPVIAGGGSLTKTGTGTFTLSGANTYSGGTTINTGTLDLTGTLSTAGDVTVNSPGVFLVDNSQTIRRLTGFGIVSVSSGKTLTVNLPGPTDPTHTAASFGGAITGAGAFAESGGGTLTLTGNSDFTGGTSINGGTLVLGKDNALPSTTQLTLASAATLDVAANQTIAGFTSSAFGSTIKIEGGSTLNVTLGNAIFGTFYYGALTDGANPGGKLEIGANHPSDDSGGHTVGLFRDATYTGGTTIDADGRLLLGNNDQNGTTGWIVGNVADNGILIFNRATTKTFGGVISGSGSVSQGTLPNPMTGLSLTTGTTILTRANTYTGGTNVYGGTLLANTPLTSGSATGTGLVTVSSAASPAITPTHLVPAAALGGTGGIAGSLVVNPGGIIEPAGDGSAGTLYIGGSATFKGGSAFSFEFNQTVGTPGQTWDLLSISQQFIIDNSALTTPILIGANGIGPSANGNIDTSHPYSWQFVSATGGITNFSAAAFTFDPGLASFGTFSVTLGNSFSGGANNALFLNFTPVPEPSTWALLATGLGAFGVIAIRRRKK